MQVSGNENDVDNNKKGIILTRTTRINKQCQITNKTSNKQATNNAINRTTKQINNQELLCFVIVVTIGLL